MRKPGSPNAASGEKRRSILSAALAVFNQKGFSEASMDDIRSKAGVSNGSLYHHFKGKDHLAAEVYLEGIRDFQAGMMEAAARDLPARDGVRELVARHLDWFEENPGWARYLTRMRHASFMMEGEGDMREANRGFGAALCGFFQRHMERGAMRRLPLGVAIALVLGPCQEYGRLRLEGVASGDPVLAAAEIAAAAWRAVGRE